MKRLITLITVFLIALTEILVAGTTHFHDQLDVVGYVDEFASITLTPVDFLPFDMDNPLLANDNAYGLNVVNWSIMANVSTGIKIKISHDALTHESADSYTGPLKTQIDYDLYVEESRTPKYLTVKTGQEDAYYELPDATVASDTSKFPSGGTGLYSLQDVPMLIKFPNEDGNRASNIAALRPGRYYSTIVVEVDYE